MNASQKEKPSSLSEVTAVAAFSVGLISAWLYVAGWTYAYHYFDRFGIPLLMVDIPKENYFVYGGIVVMQFPIWELAIVATILAVIALSRWLGLYTGQFKVPLGVLALLAVFWLGHQAAITAAHEQYAQQRESDYSAYPRVLLWPKDDAKPPESSPSSADLMNGCYRLVLYNQDRLFLLRPFRGARGADLPILITPWDQIEMMRVLPDYTSCE